MSVGAGETDRALFMFLFAARHVGNEREPGVHSVLGVVITRPAKLRDGGASPVRAEPRPRGSPPCCLHSHGEEALSEELQNNVPVVARRIRQIGRAHV